jgi:hypothetical protein
MTGRTEKKAMRKTIVRTITATTIKSANVVFEKGKPVAKDNNPITVNGVIAEDKALKEVRKAYGETAQVTEITSVDDVYEISVEDFIKYAKKVVTPTPEQKQEGATE